MPLKVLEEDLEEKQEAAANLANAKEISVDGCGNSVSFVRTGQHFHTESSTKKQH